MYCVPAPDAKSASCATLSDWNFANLGRSENVQQCLRYSYRPSQILTSHTTAATNIFQQYQNCRKSSVVVALLFAPAPWLSVPAATWDFQRIFERLMNADIEIIIIESTVDSAATLRSCNYKSQAISDRLVLQAVSVVAVSSVLYKFLLPAARKGFIVLNHSDSDYRSCASPFVSLRRYSAIYQSINGIAPHFPPECICSSIRSRLRGTGRSLPHIAWKAGASAIASIVKACDDSGSERGNSETRDISEGPSQRRGNGTGEQGSQSKEGENERSRGVGPSQPRRQLRNLQPRESIDEKSYRCPILAAGEGGILDVCWRIQARNVQYLKEVGQGINHSCHKSVIMLT